MTMNINLTPQLEELVRQKVASGQYSSASEVVREALRLMQREDQIQAAKPAQLRRDIQDGLESGPAGRLDVDAVKRRGRVITWDSMRDLATEIKRRGRANTERSTS